MRVICHQFIRYLGLPLVLSAAFAVVQAAGTGQVFVSSEKDNAVTVLDASKAEIASVIPLCLRPRHMQRAPDRPFLLVACSQDNRVLVWDIANKKVIDKLDVGEAPEMFDISPDGRMLYASNEEDATLTAFDLQTHKKVFDVKVGGEPEGVRVSADGKTVYVTSEVASVVHVVDVATRKVVKNIPVGKRPRRLLLTGQGELWVTNELSASVSIIRISDHSVQANLQFSLPGMRAQDITPVGMVLSPDGKTVYVGLGRANHVVAVEVGSRQVKAAALVGKRAWGLALSRNGKTLYVANGLSDDVSIIDTPSMKAVKSVKTGRVPHTVVVDD